MSNNSEVRSTSTARFEQSAKPMRFENIRPGSYFMIEAEPSRGVRKSNDQRMYRKAFDGFYSTVVANGAGAVLMPFDIVIPFRRKA